MDKRVYMLTIIAFIVGMSELIVGGILDLISQNFSISIGTAGLLITVFAFVFGLSSPILLVLFHKTERTKLITISLIIFFFGHLVAIFSPNFTLLMVSRIIAAASGSLATVLSINLASRIVQPAYRGRAIGLVVMGISGSLVLGLPIGVFLGHTFHWRAPFILVGGLTILLIIAARITLGKVMPTQIITLREQLTTLKDWRILFAHLTTFFFLAGHFTLYGFLTPYTKQLLHFDGWTISLLYFIYGIAAVSGGGLAGMLTDRLGNRRTLLTAILILAGCLWLIPYTTTTEILFFFWLVLVVWGIVSWAITPPIQSHLFTIATSTSDIQQSLNNAALQLGIAFGTLFGSIVVDQGTIERLPHFGIVFVVLSFIFAFSTLHKESVTVSKSR